MDKKNVITRKAYRQGELLFVPLSKEDMGAIVPKNHGSEYIQWQKLSTNVLREGEVTGHKHQVIAEGKGVATIMAPINRFLPGLDGMSRIGTEDRLIVSNGPVEVVHPEHKTLPLPGGAILVVVQREYDEIKARRILD